jgi:hypothetical protein
MKTPGFRPSPNLTFEILAGAKNGRKIRLYKSKTGPSSFGGRKNFSGQTVLFQNTFFAKCKKKKNSQG